MSIKLHICIITTSIMTIHMACARLGETEVQIKKRYGVRVSSLAYNSIDRNVATFPLSGTSAGLRPDGTTTKPEKKTITVPTGDGLINAPRTIFFYDTKTKKWGEIYSATFASLNSSNEPEELKDAIKSVRAHLKYRYYILNDISISVMYLDGKSVCETYRQKGRFMDKSLVDGLIKKSFPGLLVVDEDVKKEATRLMKIRDPKSDEVIGCSIFAGGKLMISHKAYHKYLKGIEQQIIAEKRKRQQGKLDGF